MKRALEASRAGNFSEWYQEVVRRADMAETSAVRGCMVIKPWGYGIWELIQAELDRRFKDTGHENCYFPLFIPLDFIAKEAEHVEGFAKEMAVVTHHRLKTIDGELVPDPDAELTEPLIVRPTSETIIADSFRNWISSYRDLPVLVNQWANVVRWEMRTRLFLRTAEFLWQEGHTAHTDRDDALAETMRMLEVYREFAEDVVAMPVIPGEKTENERFPGADNTYSIEAMMQDGKALQAGTSHYLGTHFAEAQGIKYQAADETEKFVHMTSWGVSTRMIGGLIMTHGDDDGLRVPPKLAPKQVVILPRLRGEEGDAKVLAYCDALRREIAAASALGAPIRVHVDAKDRGASAKRWDWVRRGAPILVEIGPREIENDQVSYLRRDDLYAGEKPKSVALAKAEFAGTVGSVLEAIQASLFDQARAMMQSRIADGFASFADLADYFGAPDADDEGADDEDEPGTGAAAEAGGGRNHPLGWARVSWCKPTGAKLDEVEEMLKPLKLTIRNVPVDQNGAVGTCIFTGEPAVEDILIARAY